MFTQTRPSLNRAEDTVRLPLARDAGYPDFIVLLNHLDTRQCYRVFLDVSAITHLGTTEFRLLGDYAERFQQHGGFLKLENASAKLAALFRSFGCAHLLAEVAKGQNSTGRVMGSG
jgi:anti-anti-sigma regulatory factor